MDKRWIYIIIILIIGISALYAIASSSYTIGRATVDVNTFVITLPDSFHIDDTDKYYASLIDRETNEKLNVIDLDNADSIDDLIQEEYKDCKKDKSLKIENETTSYDNITIKTIYVISDDGVINSSSYFMKFNHTFNIEASNFKDKDSIENNIKFIIESLAKDYKQKQD